MLLALDVGNTETAFGLHDGQAWLGQWRVMTEKGATADQWALTIDSLLRLDGWRLREIEEMALASGVPQVTATLSAMARKRLGRPPMVVSADLAGMEIGYLAPQTLGADRIANAVAAWDFYRSAVLVVDFGTATNFEYVNPEGKFEGGLIAPGLKVTGEALTKRTAQLPQVDVFKSAPKLIATDTVGGLTAGLYYGYLGLIRALIKGLKAEAGTDPKVMATGGLAPVFAEKIDFDRVDPRLTLEGVRLILERNRGGER
ncbi:MAG: type III pantothenate kinase [Deltaproteobacteria bacterium]|nr:type III pantothenate kinase [Deltaproteobacteria bacterium]